MTTDYARHQIEIYRHQGGWAFDDPKHGLVAEALIEGADTLVDLIAAHFGWSRLDRFTLQFSDTPGRFTFALYRTGESNGGTDYVLENEPFQGHKVWLCPALRCYFDPPPRFLSLELSPVAKAASTSG